MGKKRILAMLGRMVESNRYWHHTKRRHPRSMKDDACREGIRGKTTDLIEVDGIQEYERNNCAIRAFAPEITGEETLGMATDSPLSVDCTKLLETEKAMLFEVVTQHNGLLEIWMPKSEIEVEDVGGGDDQFSVKAPEWLWIAKCQDEGVELSGYDGGYPVIITPHGLE